MSRSTADDFRYPIGKFAFTEPEIQKWLDELEALPAELGEATAMLNDGQLDTPYRDGGWTVRQVVHHVADSHANSYIRFRLAVTEDEPTIKPYAEDRWAELEDAKFSPIAVSLDLLDAIHRRWIRLLRSLDEGQWQRAFVHPENGRTTLEYALGLYAWHGKHHLAHVINLRRRMGW